MYSFDEPLNAQSRTAALAVVAAMSESGNFAWDEELWAEKIEEAITHAVLEDRRNLVEALRKATEPKLIEVPSIQLILP